MLTERRKAASPTPTAKVGVVELMPGHVVLGLAGDQFKTLLGSCVSVILTDPRRTVGTMCHIVHVGKPNAANAHNTAYGEVAMQDMFDRLISVAIPPARCHAYGVVSAPGPNCCPPPPRPTMEL
jgi:chemotaxis protein CheD